MQKRDRKDYYEVRVPSQRKLWAYGNLPKAEREAEKLAKQHDDVAVVLVDHATDKDIERREFRRREARGRR